MIVKAHLQRMGPTVAKAAALHIRYIERDGVEKKDGSKGVLYDAQGPVRASVFEQPRPGEKNQFRFIVSPEDGSELDLTSSRPNAPARRATTPWYRTAKAASCC